jgi:hypothetical protein
MRTASIPALIAVFLSLASCSPSQQVTSSWVNRNAIQSKKYTGLFIVVISHDQGVKSLVENELAYAASTERGLKVFNSSEFLAPGFTKKMLDKDTVLARAKELGCDAILAVALVDEKSETKHDPGVPNYAPYYGYHNGFGGYYSYMGPSMYSPGHDVTHTTYFIEANVFDVATEALVWSVQSKAYDPASIAEASREYADLLVDQVSKDIGPKAK